MDGNSLDEFARRWKTGDPSRRRLLHGLAGALVAALGRAGANAAAEGKAARGGGRGRPDHCLQEQKECRHGGQCCSGLCKGKKGRKRCRRAPGQGTCTIDRNVCKVGNPGNNFCNGGACVCGVTTQGTAFCGDLFTDVCAVCDSGADCVALGFPAGSACIRVGGLCEECAAEGGTKCVTPC